MEEIRQSIVQIITGTIGALGFSIYFRVSKKNVLASMLGGGIGWTIYLIVFHFSKDLFLSNFVAAVVVFFWSEIMARILKAPSNTFLVPGLIPLIPGGSLFYTTKSLVESNAQGFVNNGIKTTKIVFGMAAGMVFAAFIVYCFIKTGQNKKTKNN